MIAVAAAMQRVAETWTAETVDDLVAGIGCHLYSRQVAESLSRAAVEESGIGNAAEACTRLRARILGTLQEMEGARTIGLLDCDETRGLKRYAKPIGVIVALTPATAPVATVVVHALNAIKTRNAIIFCSNPGVLSTVAETVQALRAALDRLAGAADLVQMACSPIREHLDEIIQAADLVLATGSNRTVSRALRLGTPGYGGGVGNAIILIDETADVDRAAAQIVAGKAFDNGTSCSSESCVIVHRGRLTALADALTRCGGRMLDAAESAQLMRWVWPDGRLRRTVIGRTADEIAAAAGLAPHAGTRVLILPAEPAGMHLVSREKLSPILGLVAVADAEEMLATAREMLDREGKGHSCGIFSEDQDRIEQVARGLPVSRLMINQSTGFGNTGNPANGMPSTVVLSCGTWGRTNTNDNITWRHLLNYTTVSEPIAARVPDEQVLFGRHWAGESSVPSAVASAIPA